MWEYNYTIDNYELYHHGIKGQKWGIRRFQNKDGSLTNAGRTRYGSDGKITSQAPNNSTNNLKTAKTAVDATSELVRTTKKVKSDVKSLKNEKKAAEAQARIRYDISQMSDKELQQAVNRLNMEERYSQVMQSREVGVGRDRVDQMLDYAGTALVIGSSALSIAVSMKQLRG